jgi:hypothetical protein
MDRGVAKSERCDANDAPTGAFPVGDVELRRLKAVAWSISMEYVIDSKKRLNEGAPFLDDTNAWIRCAKSAVAELPN